MINYDNIDIYKEKQNIPGETVAQLSEPPELKKNSQNEIEREDQAGWWSYGRCTDKKHYWR